MFACLEIYSCTYKGGCNLARIIGYRLIAMEENKLCQEDPIGAGILVAIMGPPEVS